jgi:hypothetical protein
MLILVFDLVSTYDILILILSMKLAKVERDHISVLTFIIIFYYFFYLYNCGAISTGVIPLCSEILTWFWVMIWDMLCYPSWKWVIGLILSIEKLVGLVHHDRLSADSEMQQSVTLWWAWECWVPSGLWVGLPCAMVWIFFLLKVSYARSFTYNAAVLKGGGPFRGN